MNWFHLSASLVIKRLIGNYFLVIYLNLATGGVFVPSNEIPSLHYLGHVEENNVAHRANLRPGDYILEVSPGQFFLFRFCSLVIQAVAKDVQL